MATQASRTQPDAGRGGADTPRATAEPLIYCEIYSPMGGKNAITCYPNERVDLLEAREPDAGRPLVLMCVETRTGKRFTVSTTLPFLLIRNLTPAQVYLSNT